MFHQDIYKIGKKTEKVNESDANPMNDLLLEKSKVYVESKSGGDVKMAEYDKKMLKKKWESPYFNHLDYVGKGVFQGRKKQSSGTGNDVTITVFKGLKNIATHTYYEP